MRHNSVQNPLGAMARTNGHVELRTQSQEGSTAKTNSTRVMMKCSTGQQVFLDDIRRCISVPKRMSL